ncbi:hypothetical protein [Kitasatospora sp. NPDC085879]|uniref:hypothetical protein n=1 Tax=Kitasatospora sp. NPDC085879 TaxID=3154769 RepID=UPI000BB12CEB|nr:hypothetical protein [Streptomyces sp. TLI_235]PBC70098.1 hypothetical protein BX265_7486 [Streptomyces sp. TLI_235]
MPNNHFHAKQFRPNVRLLTVGAAMAGAGAFVGVAGVALVATALATAGRRMVTAWETHPAEMAARTARQAASASSAARDAWRSTPV